MDIDAVDILGLDALVRHLDRELHGLTAPGTIDMLGDLDAENPDPLGDGIGTHVRLLRLIEEAQRLRGIAH